MIICYVAPGFEEIEALNPVDCLRRCEKDVLVVGVGGVIVRGSHGITVIADAEDNEPLDFTNLEMLILPGGMPGTLNLEKSEFVSKAIDYCAKHDIPIAAICAAPSILGHKGLLNGKKAVCYKGFEDQLIGATVLYDPVCHDGNIITARGMGCADLFSYEIVKTLISKDKADRLFANIIKG